MSEGLDGETGFVWLNILSNLRSIFRRSLPCIKANEIQIINFICIKNYETHVAIIVEGA